MPKVNQQMIAERANVSRATVSRCFTNHPGINPETRATVFRLASEFGYHHLEPRTGGRKKNKSLPTVGVLICTRVQDYLRTDYQSPGQAIHAGICEYAQLNNLRLELHYTSPDDFTLEGPSYGDIATRSRKSWGGCLLIYPFPTKVIDELRKMLPVVSLVEPYAADPLDCVDVDHFAGISSMVDHLLALGHRRMGFFTMEYQIEAGWSFRRHSAFVEKMCRMKQSVPPGDEVNIFPNCFPSVEMSFDHVARRIREGVTAWVCAADHQAYELIAALKSRGIDVPGQVSVTGFDGVRAFDNRDPLTTVEIPYREIGFTGTRRLHDLMRKRFTTPQHINVGCRVRQGSSTASPSGLQTDLIGVTA